MLDIGSKITQLRKAKNWSQGELAEKIEASRAIIDKYERNENLPSVEMVIKMAKAFAVSVDYLLGEGEYASYDKETTRRLQDIEKLDPTTKTKIFDIIEPTYGMLKQGRPTEYDNLLLYKIPKLLILSHKHKNHQKSLP